MVRKSEPEAVSVFSSPQFKLGFCECSSLFHVECSVYAESKKQTEQENLFLMEVDVLDVEATTDNESGTSGKSTLCLFVP